jgi:prepilin-type N-terminal cleavage/methylation domain-containing protein
MNPLPSHPEPAMPGGVVPPGAGSPPSLPLHLGEGRGGGAFRRPAFTLVELLVVMAVILVLMGLMGGAMSAARTSRKKQATQALIARLDAIIQQQFATYAAQPVVTSGSIPPGFPGRSAYRSWYIRRNLISADLPDRWTDVAVVANGTTVATTINGTSSFLPLTGPQRAYQDVWNSFTPLQRTIPGTDAKQHVSTSYAGAECLFMIVMQGGVADCLDCGSLRTADIGDKDADGAYEFWDAWQNPIGFILWPAAVVPAASGAPFFSGDRALSDPFSAAAATSSPGLGMRPLIYSAGPDGEYGYERNKEAGNLMAGSSPAGRDCGNWLASPALNSAAPLAGSADNITNFDAEVAK